ncbi:hypothetical protein BC937DRAFT_93188 [Endogone sp. FLAS-F59071]|nr:hypothetical protein BC937DRAFT_93188 [Endogone sp. FLAS-F59071]|eukprot:RUS21260.1 hypothetical protein BC937DRAFT_93188 [Endogone sp. FLAS-F59071]
MTDKPQQPTQSIVVNPVAQTETPNDSSFGLQPSAPVSPAPATSTCIDYFNFQHHATAGTSTTASYAPPPSSYQGTGSATALETDVITNPDGYSDSTNGAGLRVPSSADYALDRLFAEFENAANHRMTIFLTSQLDREVDLTNFIGQDLDVSFDRLLKSLGALASHRPKPVMDLIMKWRKSKSGAPDPQILATMTAPTLTDKASGARTSQTATQAAPSLSVAQITSILRQRQSVCSIFILCRALVAIVEQLQPESLSEELGEQLEEMVLRQMRGADPDMIHRNKNRAANMALFAQLLGALSLIRFASVSDKFIVELERYNRDVTKEKENQSKVEMVIKGMRYLKLKIYPDYALEDTADFLQSCAKFFKNAHGVKVKHAYAHLFVQLMLPIAAVAVAEVNFPAWVRAVDLIYPRALKMTTKPRHLTYGLPLVTTLLCVSKKDFFVNNWLQIVETCNQRFTKDKNTRQVALGCVCRLLWVYLYRCSEGTNATYRKLDAIIKTLYPSRRSINPADTPLDHFVQIAYFILMRHQDYGMENLIEYLLNADSLGPFQLYNVPLEIFAPERVTIAIRAYMLMLADLEKMEARPAFPISTDMRVTGISMRPLADLLSEKVIGRGIARETLEKMKEIMGKILVVLDQTYGNLIVTHEKNITRHPLYAVPSTVGAAAPPLVADSNLVTHHYASFSVSYPKERQPYFDLLRTIIDTMPRLMPAGLSLPKVVDLLCKYTVHIDPEVARAASEALIRIAKQMDAVTPVIGYAQYLQRFEDRFADVMTSLADGRFTGENRNGDANILKLYVNLLTIWVDQVNTEMLLRSDNGLDREKTPINENARDAEIAAIWSIIDDTEVNGVLFLCSRMTWVRRCAVQVLRLTADFEKRLEQQYKGSEKLDRPPSLVSQLTSHILNRDHTRVYQLLEQVGPDLVKIDKETNTLVGQRIGSAERGRIYQHQRRETKDVILMLASSDHVSDVTIWNTILPELVNILFESFPKTVAICRNNIYNRLIQIQPSIQATIDSVRSNPSGTISMTKIGSSKTTAATDDLIEQWRIYVTFACATIAVNDDHLPRRMATPKDLFKAILPYIACEHSLIRDAAVVSLGRINRSAYKVLMEDLQRFVRNIIEDSKQKTNQKPHLTKRNRKFDRLRIEVMHLYQLTADSLSRETYLRDDAIVDMIMTYVKETKSFLADAEVQMDWDFQKLRRYFCGLVERLYENLSRLEDPTKIMSFETRLSLFKMFEQWCGYGQSSKDTRDREARMLKDLLDQCKDSKERGILTSNMEDERKALETAALGAMAALCVGIVELQTI